MNLNVALKQEIWVDGKQVDEVIVDKTRIKDNAVGGIGTFATATSMV
jgi:hypothetical protein